MELEPEQTQLFFDMVEAAREAPRDEREWYAFATGGGDILQGPGGQRTVILSDIHELERLGLLHRVQGTDEGYLISPEGYTRHDEMKREQGEPVEEGAGNEPAAQPPDPKKVMVVYGRDSEANKAMFDFLRALDLKPQEWTTLIRYTNSGAPYVGDVLAGGFSNAQAVVVLLTPDDEARMTEELRGEHEPDHETALIGQARPNVLFEAGMAFGTHPDRTIVVELGTLRPFSDIHGRHTIRLDGTVPPLREIARRLQTAGCAVDDSGDDWLRTDRFPAPRHRGGSSTADGAGRRELLTAAASAVTNALGAFERRKGATDENVTERGEAFDASVHEVSLLANQVTIEFGQQHPATQAYERALTRLRALKAMVFDAKATTLQPVFGENAAEAAREAASEFIGAARAS
ncbi:MAG: TIR domain-containing protein [Solirubrobacteraceae bacterium]